MTIFNGSNGSISLISFCNSNFRTHKGIWWAKFWLDKWLNTNLNGERSQCDEMPFKSKIFFRPYWNSFTCKATFRLHARQRCRRSCSSSSSKAETHPCHSQFWLNHRSYKGVLLNQHAASSCQICREALNNRMIILNQKGKFKFFIRVHTKLREFDKVSAEPRGANI
jgi:hypothetical protein